MANENTYQEKANYKHKEKCKRFIEEHIGDTNNHETKSKALKLTKKLIGSMIRSQRFFDYRIKREVEIVRLAESDIAKDIAIINFNNKKIALILDADGQKVFESLNQIIKNN